MGFCEFSFPVEFVRLREGIGCQRDGGFWPRGANFLHRHFLDFQGAGRFLALEDFELELEGGVVFPETVRKKGGKRLPGG